MSEQLKSHPEDNNQDHYPEASIWNRTIESIRKEREDEIRKEIQNCEEKIKDLQNASTDNPRPPLEDESETIYEEYLMSYLRGLALADEERRQGESEDECIRRLINKYSERKKYLESSIANQESEAD